MSVNDKLKKLFEKLRNVQTGGRYLSKNFTIPPATETADVVKLK